MEFVALLGIFFLPAKRVQWFVSIVSSHRTYLWHLSFHFNHFGVNDSTPSARVTPTKPPLSSPLAGTPNNAPKPTVTCPACHYMNGSVIRYDGHNMSERRVGDLMRCGIYPMISKKLSDVILSIIVDWDEWNVQWTEVYGLRKSNNYLYLLKFRIQKYH